jgi:hypothetical protein
MWLAEHDTTIPGAIVIDGRHAAEPGGGTHLLYVQAPDGHDRRIRPRAGTHNIPPIDDEVH